MDQITRQVKIDPKRLIQLEKACINIPSFKKEFENSLTKDTTQLIELVLMGAIELGASDVHLEPEEKQVKLRFRLDGLLQDILLIDLAIYKVILSRLKLLGEVKLNINAKAQDGRFSVVCGDKTIEIRMSTLPAGFGEAVVLRVLSARDVIDLKELGIRDDALGVFNHEIKKPNGLILITGPTGSGKTTTLYGILKTIASPELKVVTIEDPIEYRLPGISQTQVDIEDGYDFANGLEAIVRQDPDIILVGEIRDEQTAKITIQASLTGHMVLSTLHTNDAAGTVARLQALGEIASNIAPALSLAIGQRLVRKVCETCKKMELVTDPELNLFSQYLTNLPSNLKIPILNSSLKIAKPVGCDSCNQSGYKGRIGIFEFFVVDDEMENFILKSPSIVDLKKRATEKGMLTMFQDGLIKVLEGITTLEEVQRESTP
ncbi:MAG: GspE/PulE family protein [Candidatus Gribaldobacteria bacterium]|nr:GspE/PulE family protein [Candidatus Gribaldobacteria bacterium]